MDYANEGNLEFIKQVKAVYEKVEEIRENNRGVLHLTMTDFASYPLPTTQEEEEKVAQYLENSVPNSRFLSVNRGPFDDVYEKLCIYEKALEKKRSQFSGKQPFLEKERDAYCHFLGVLLRIDRNITEKRLEDFRTWRYRKEELHGVSARKKEEIHSEYLLRLRYGLLDLAIEENSSPKTQENELNFNYRLKSLILDTKIEEEQVIYKEVIIGKNQWQEKDEMEARIKKQVEKRKTLLVHGNTVTKM